jgi:ABC-type polysaccharide/polyol phosphate transport system ATPase subunit
MLTVSGLTVIGLTGKKQNGKSSIYNYIAHNVNKDSGPIVMRYSFAQPLKAICHILFGGTADHWYDH